MDARRVRYIRNASKHSDNNGGDYVKVIGIGFLCL